MVVPTVTLKEVTIRKAKEENAEKLADMSKRAFHTDVECGSPWGETGPPGYDSPKAHIRFMQSSDYYEIYDDGILVGGIMVLEHKDQHYECVGLFVDPDYHNRGIATHALAHIWLLYPAAKRWTVGTPRWNKRTTHFYEKLGFVEIGSDGEMGVVYERQGG